ncbi:nucleoside phosphorylase domain-containing protein [Hyaloraphidium curvatum]|nr:nucleoside phosphorylase domain-containing protein [Hyaloraphidium curvatum]
MDPLTLVLTAMPTELQAVRSRLPPGSFSRVPDLPVEAFLAPKHGILLARAGVGPIAAGWACGVLLSRFALRRMVLIGVAGALHADLRPGDLVIATAVVQHDALFLGDKGTALMRPGALHVSISPGERPDPVMNADAGLLASLPKAAMKGVLVSGAMFAGTTASKMDLLSRVPGALAVDMEAAAIAFAADTAKIPWAVCKTISDRFEHAGHIEDEFLTWMPRAAEHAAEVVDALFHDVELEG